MTLDCLLYFNGHFRKRVLRLIILCLNAISFSINGGIRRNWLGLGNTGVDHRARFAMTLVSGVNDVSG